MADNHEFDDDESVSTLHTVQNKHTWIISLKGWRICKEDRKSHYSRLQQTQRVRLNFSLLWRLQGKLIPDFSSFLFVNLRVMGIIVSVQRFDRLASP